MNTRIKSQQLAVSISRILLLLVLAGGVSDVISQNLSKESDYARQGEEAFARGNFTLACEDYQIASNFAKGSGSNRFQSIDDRRLQICNHAQNIRDAESSAYSKSRQQKMNRFCRGRPTLDLAVYEHIAAKERVDPSSIRLQQLSIEGFSSNCTAKFYHPRGVHTCNAGFSDDGRLVHCH
jgi:hypothetical protein